MILTTLITATIMMFEMPTLPYAHNALEPVISQATIDFHYGKHLQTYVNNLNNLAPGTEFEGKALKRLLLQLLMVRCLTMRDKYLITHSISCNSLQLLNVTSRLDRWPKL